MSIRNLACATCGRRLQAAGGDTPPQGVRCPACEGRPVVSTIDDGPGPSGPPGDGPLLLAVSLAALALVGGGVAAVVFWPESDHGPGAHPLAGRMLAMSGRSGASIGIAVGAGLTGADASSIAAGRRVFEKNNCDRCHPAGGGASERPVRGKGGKGKGARQVSLSGVGSRRGLDYLMGHVRDPRGHDPSSGMPGHGEDRISANELRDLGAYLSSLK